MTIRRMMMPLVLLAGAFVPSTLAAGQVHAAFGICRTDPVVTLSDGTQLTLATDIEGSAAGIVSVNYRLHIPRNVSVVSVAYDQYGYLENLSVLANQKPGEYTSVTQVTTKTTSDVTAYLAVAGTTCTQHTNQTVGTSGAMLRIGVTC